MPLILVKLILALLLSAVPTFAANYYVDNTHGMASDSNAGTSA